MICCGGRKKKSLAMWNISWQCDHCFHTCCQWCSDNLKDRNKSQWAGNNSAWLLWTNKQHCAFLQLERVVCSLSPHIHTLHSVSVPIKFVLEEWKNERILLWYLGYVSWPQYQFRQHALDGEQKQKEEDDAKKIQKKKKLCSKIMDIHRGGQCKCEILGVKAVLSCQNANLTVMIVSHFK